MNIKKLNWIIPFLILITLVFILWRELFFAKHDELPSTLIGQDVPSFQLQDILNVNKTFTSESLHGKVSLLNIWATWCSACADEHTSLLNIQKKYHINIYSIAYKDDANKVRYILETKGNPYRSVGDDSKGNVGIDFGVYGTPETYVISPTGKILYRYIGALTEEDFENAIYPLIKQYEH